MPLVLHHFKCIFNRKISSPLFGIFVTAFPIPGRLFDLCCLNLTWIVQTALCEPFQEFLCNHLSATASPSCVLKHFTSDRLGNRRKSDFTILTTLRAVKALPDHAFAAFILDDPVTCAEQAQVWNTPRCTGSTSKRLDRMQRWSGPHQATFF